MGINFVKGDATAPIGVGPKLIVHVCNDLGKWGKGFVLAISKRWKGPEKLYKESFSMDPVPSLGEVQYIEVSGDITVANLIGQHGIRRKDSKGEAPIRYPAIHQGLQSVAVYAKNQNASVHMPRIGCGLAGGKWEDIEPLIESALVAEGIDVTVYDY